MNAAVIVILVIFIILILAGLGVGLYFLLRPKSPPGGMGGTTGGAPGANPAPPGTSAPGGLPGSFSIQPTSNTNLYLTFDTTTSNQFPNAVLYDTPSISTIPCDNLIWRNTIIPASTNNPLQATSSALQNNARTITVQGNAQDPPFYLVAQVGDGAFVTNNILDGNPATWVYNSTNQTFCGSGADSNNCLYMEFLANQPAVTRKPLDATDEHFKWTISPPISPPSCLASN